MSVTTVAVLRGGPSDEYEISMQTGEGALTALQELSYNTKDIVITKEGDWLLQGYKREPEEALFAVDVVFIALHGSYGEDGTVQRILDRYNIPYTGSTPLASGIAMNKILTKEQLGKVGIKTPKGMRVTREGVTDPHKTALSISSLFGSKYIVKPVFGGSSLGIKIAQSPTDLGSVLAELLPAYEDLLVEEYIPGREATVGILENFRDRRHYTLPVIEIIPPDTSEFFSEDVKYTGTTQEICPGCFSKKEKRDMEDIATQVHKVLNLRHYSRSDFIINKNGIYFLEVNTLPGLTAQSLFPKATEAVGETYKGLIHHLVSQAKV